MHDIDDASEIGFVVAGDGVGPESFADVGVTVVLMMLVMMWELQWC